MQRKFLEDLGLDKEVVDKIMAKHGTSVESLKTRLEAERDGFKSQLDTANETLKSFEGVDVNELQGKIKTLTDDLAAKEEEHKAKIADMEFNTELDRAISKSAAKNVKAVKALLDIDTLKASNNRATDIENALKTVKEENAYLFGSDEPFQNPTAPTNQDPPPSPMAQIRAAMGLD